MNSVGIDARARAGRDVAIGSADNLAASIASREVSIAGCNFEIEATISQVIGFRWLV